MAVKLRGALLGAGNIALRGHAPQWMGDARLRDEVEMVAVADLSPPNLEAIRALCPGIRTYACAEDLMAQERLDFCDICTPPSSHLELVELAAGKGLHLFCEKPLSHTLSAALRIGQAVRRAGVIFQPCHQYHYSPQWLMVKGLLPRIGRIYLAEYRVQRLAANEGNPHWDPRWRTDPDLSGGGILVDHGAHIFYQLRSVLGEPRTVQATVRTLFHRGYEVEDTAFVTLDAIGVVAQVSLTWAARQREIYFRFVGEQGELVGTETGIRVQAAATEEFTLPGGMSANSSHSEWYAPLMLEFTERVRRGDRSQGPLDEALYVTRVISRAYESGRQGCTLPLENGDGVEGPAATAGTVADEAGVEPEARIEVLSSVASERRSARERAFRAGAYVLLIGTAVWTFRDVRWSALTSTLGAAAPLWIAFAAGMNLLALVFQAARWLALVRPLSRAATLPESFKAMMVGYTVSMILPARGGELARAHFLGRRTGLSRTTVLGSIVLDHLVNATGLLAGLAVLPFFVGIPDWMRSGGWIALALVLLGITAVAALRPIQRDGGPAPSEALPARRIGVLLTKLQHGLTGARQPKALGVSFAASLVSWVLEVPVVVWALWAVGLHLPIPAAFLILASVNLALMFPVAPPANLGTVELGATLALLQFGVPKEQALAFALTYHLLQVVPIAALGMFFAGKDGLGTTFRRAPA